MYIPMSATVPFYLASFIVAAFQYQRINPDRRLLNLRFGLMAGAIALMIVTICVTNNLLSVILFLLALFWLGCSIWLLRRMPPPSH